jgi:adenosylcobyric acid synthase
VADLEWLRRTGLAQSIVDHSARGLGIFGICGGFQMLCSSITDHVESRRGTVDGLGLLDAEIEFVERKTLRRPSGTAFGAPVRGYEIHHGTLRTPPQADPLVRLDDGGTEGAITGGVLGTHWHGLAENDAFRRELLTWAARLAGRDGFTVATGTCFDALRTAQFDLLADLVDKHLDHTMLGELLNGGAPGGLPVLPPAGQTLR